MEMNGEGDPDNSASTNGSRVIDVILYNKTNEMPAAHMFLGSSLQKIQLMKVRHFWIFEIDNLSPDITSFDLHISPEGGPTVLHTVHFSENQPFIFIDSLQENEMVPFNEFLLFFNTATTSKNPLSFNFFTDNPIQKIEQFITSFEDKYFLWSLLYLSAQPWFELFQFNEELQKLLLSIIPQYILSHYYEPIRYPYTFDPKSYISTFQSPLHIQNQNLQIYNFDPTQYLSSNAFIDTFFHFLRVQIGEGFVYLVSLFFDFDKDFPFTSYIPPLTDYPCSKEVCDLLSKLIIAYSSYDEKELLQVYEKIYYCILMTATSQFKLDMEPLFAALHDQINYEMIAKIINDRMILTESITPDSIKFIISIIPRFNNVIQVFRSENTFIPIEWINIVSSLWEIPDLTNLIIGSLRHSVPGHYKSKFAKITRHGGMIQDDSFDESQTILQPGAIIQTGAKIGARTMLSSGSIAPKDSVLEDNSFAFRNGIVTREQRVIADSVIFRHPVWLKRGVTIDDNCVVCENSSIGSGTQIQHDSIIGAGTNIGSGCIIESGQKVPPSTEVPAGFRFSKDVIEYERKIPEVIQRYSIMFLKRHSGYSDLKTVLSFEVPKIIDIIIEYFSCLGDYPREIGRQISSCREKLDELKDIDKQAVLESLYAIFGANTILIAGSYWTEQSKITEQKPIENSVWNEIILELCKHAIHNFILSVEELRNENYIDAINLIVDYFQVMNQNGIEENEISIIKKAIYDLCDNAILRLKLSEYSDTDNAILNTFQSLIKRLNFI